MYLSRIKTILNWLFLPCYLTFIYFSITDTTPPWIDYLLGSNFMLAAISYGIDYIMEERVVEKKTFLIVAVIFAVIAILIFLIKPIKSGII
jgi:hypothetical protein